MLESDSNKIAARIASPFAEAGEVQQLEVQHASLKKLIRINKQQQKFHIGLIPAWASDITGKVPIPGEEPSTVAGTQ